jgi:hypothetical protein
LADWFVRLANLELQSDLRDLAAEVGTRIGLDARSTDEQLRDAVIRKAERYDIQLDPGQVTVIRSDTGADSTVYLAVDYTARVNLFVYSFNLHFTPSNTK